MNFKNLEQLNETIEQLDLLASYEQQTKLGDTIHSIVEELNNIFCNIEDDFYSYENRIEEIEDTLQCFKEGYDFGHRED